MSNFENINTSNDYTNLRFGERKGNFQENEYDVSVTDSNKTGFVNLEIDNNGSNTFIYDVPKGEEQIALDKLYRENLEDTIFTSIGFTYVSRKNRIIDNTSNSVETYKNIQKLKSKIDTKTNIQRETIANSLLKTISQDWKSMTLLTAEFGVEINKPYTEKNRKDVIKLQKELGLSPDGIPGKSFYNKMKSTPKTKIEEIKNNLSNLEKVDETVKDIKKTIEQYKNESISNLIKYYNGEKVPSFTDKKIGTLENNSVLKIIGDKLIDQGYYIVLDGADFCIKSKDRKTSKFNKQLNKSIDKEKILITSIIGNIGGVSENYEKIVTTLISNYGISKDTKGKDKSYNIKDLIGNKSEKNKTDIKSQVEEKLKKAIQEKDNKAIQELSFIKSYVSNSARFKNTQKEVIDGVQSTIIMDTISNSNGNLKGKGKGLSQFLDGMTNSPAGTMLLMAGIVMLIFSGTRKYGMYIIGGYLGAKIGAEGIRQLKDKFGIDLNIGSLKGGNSDSGSYEAAEVEKKGYTKKESLTDVGMPNDIEEKLGTYSEDTSSSSWKALEKLPESNGNIFKGKTEKLKETYVVLAKTPSFRNMKTSDFDFSKDKEKEKEKEKDLNKKLKNIGFKKGDDGKMYLTLTETEEKLSVKEFKVFINSLKKAEHSDNDDTFDGLFKGKDIVTKERAIVAALGITSLMFGAPALLVVGGITGYALGEEEIKKYFDDGGEQLVEKINGRLVDIEDEEKKKKIIEIIKKKNTPLTDKILEIKKVGIKADNEKEIIKNLIEIEVGITDSFIDKIKDKSTLNDSQLIDILKNWERLEILGNTYNISKESKDSITNNINIYNPKNGLSTFGKTLFNEHPYLTVTSGLAIGALAGWGTIAGGGVVARTGWEGLKKGFSYFVKNGTIKTSIVGGTSALATGGGLYYLYDTFFSSDDTEKEYEDKDKENKIKEIQNKINAILKSINDLSKELNSSKKNKIGKIVMSNFSYEKGGFNYDKIRKDIKANNISEDNVEINTFIKGLKKLSNQNGLVNNKDTTAGVAGAPAGAPAPAPAVVSTSPNAKSISEIVVTGVDYKTIKNIKLDNIKDFSGLSMIEENDTIEIFLSETTRKNIIKSYDKKILNGENIGEIKELVKLYNKFKSLNENKTIELDKFYKDIHTVNETNNTIKFAGKNYKFEVEKNGSVYGKNKIDINISIKKGKIVLSKESVEIFILDKTLFIKTLSNSIEDENYENIVNSKRYYLQISN